jgi:adenylylsulfate kinase
MLGREAKEALLRQRGTVFWLYGLSGSGKSTLANAFERRLHGDGLLTQILDGDNIRSGLNSNLGFSDADRAENIRRIAEVAKLYVHTGVVTIASFICPTRALRQQAREIIGAEDFHEVYVKASYATCAARDQKGLYAKAQAGGIRQFTGKDSGFEAPDEGDERVLVLDTETHSVELLVEILLSHQQRTALRV